MKAFRKALVTGGAGFIGSHLIDRLLRENIKVICLDNFFSGKKENIEHHFFNDNFFLVEGDVTDFNLMENLISDGVDVVFNQAASKKTVCLNNPKQDLEINAKGTLNLLQLAVKFNVKKFIHASTGSVYGEVIILPQKEDHPFNPTSFYGVSKLAGERYVNVFNQNYGLNTTILRYFHVFGPRQDSSNVGGVVSIFTRGLIEDSPLKIFGDGTQERSFTFIDDVIESNIQSLFNKQSKGKVYNCASGISVTINQLYYELRKQINQNHSSLSYEDWLEGDIKKFNISNDLICRDLNMKFLKDWKLGLKKTIDWGFKKFS